MKVVREATAWDSIGWDDGFFRIKGGRTLYEGVFYEGQHKLVRLDRLNMDSPDGKLRVVHRYVDPDTILEFFEDDCKT